LWVNILTIIKDFKCKETKSIVNGLFYKKLPQDIQRLARYFGMPVGFWTGIQVHYDAEMAKMQLGDRWEREVKKYDPAA
jgi:plasmid maintenance system antidote protein VapI